MQHTLFNLRGFAHLYRSLLRFCKMSSYEAKELCFMLNLANIDTHITHCPHCDPRECSARDFYRRLDTEKERPYRTEVQLYRSLEALLESIDRSLIPHDEREALERIRAIMENLETTFYKSFGMDIAEKRTIYALCASDLTPKDTEPSVCLRDDWQALTPVLLARRRSA